MDHQHQANGSKSITTWAQVIIFLLGNFATFFWFQRGVVDVSTQLQKDVAELRNTVKDLQSTISQYNAAQVGNKADIDNLSKRVDRIEDRVFPTKPTQVL